FKAPSRMGKATRPAPAPFPQISTAGGRRTARLTGTCFRAPAVPIPDGGGITMRRIVCLAAVLVVAASGAARADDPADLRKVIDKAIKAMGGEEKLAKFKAETFKMKGKFYGTGEAVDYTGEWQVQPPDKIRVQVDGEVGGMKVTFFTQVVNGDKVWQKG